MYYSQGTLALQSFIPLMTVRVLRGRGGGAVVEEKLRKRPFERKVSPWKIKTWELSFLVV